MKLTKIHVENFRLLKNTDIDIDDSLSLIVGRNNTGKTSLKILLDIFLNNQNNFTLNDFNIDAQVAFRDKIKVDLEKDDAKILEEANYDFAIKMFLHISYSKEDSDENLRNISDFILDLDESKHDIVLGFAYYIDDEKYLKFLRAFKKQNSEFKRIKKDDNFELPDALSFLKNDLGSFTTKRIYVDVKGDYGIPKSAESSFKIEDVNKLINFKFISAERDVYNPNNANKGNRQVLSALAAKYWKIRRDESLNGVTEEASDIIDKEIELSAEFILADKNFTKIYNKAFNPILTKIKELSTSKYPLTILSSLQGQSLLSQNTIVGYQQANDIYLPEHYNGLGYMNLIEIIFDLTLAIDEMENYNHGEMADINILFIEEPEAHMHPQMQVIFIKNIEKLLKLKNGTNVQTLLSTHSSHIVANSKFEQFKYFIDTGNDGVKSKNLNDLKPKSSRPDVSKENSIEDRELIYKYAVYDFVTKYLTISRADIFFADKLIIIEGSTERILIPYMIKKIDLEDNGWSNETSLSSQNVSVIEAGAYASVFKDVIEFLSIKTLIITDIDFTISANNGLKSTHNKHEYNGSDNSSNVTIKYFFANDKLDDLKLKNENERTVLDGKVLIAYQQPETENNYWARSFEDAFISINHEWLKELVKNEGVFSKSAIKNCDKFLKGFDYYNIADTCIKSKTVFATAVIFESTNDLSKWNTPKYIKDGLVWLSKK